MEGNTETLGHLFDLSACDGGNSSRIVVGAIVSLYPSELHNNRWDSRPAVGELRQQMTQRGKQWRCVTARDGAFFKI